MSIFEGQIIGEREFDGSREYVDKFGLEYLNFKRLGIIPSTGDELKIREWQTGKPLTEPIMKNGECMGALVYPTEPTPVLCLQYDDSLPFYNMHINPINYKYICFILKEKEFWGVTIYNLEKVQRLYKNVVSLANIVIRRGVTLIESGMYRLKSEEHRLGQYTAHVVMNANVISRVIDGLMGEDTNILQRIGV